MRAHAARHACPSSLPVLTMSPQIFLPDGRPWAGSTELSQLTDQQQNFHPYKVQLYVFDGPTHEPRTQTIFVRSDRASNAGNIAHRLWERWFREERGIPKHQKYPSIQGSGHICSLDNSDWNYYLKEGKRIVRNGIRGDDGKPAAFLGAKAGKNAPPVAFCITGINFDKQEYMPRVRALPEDIFNKPIDPGQATPL